MKRPRIALWIMRHRHGWREWDDRPILWCPNWLWLWAVRRVDRWHDGFQKVPFDTVSLDKPLGKYFKTDSNGYLDFE